MTLYFMEEVVFHAKILDREVSRVRLRFKTVAEGEYAFADFEEISANELVAKLKPNDLGDFKFYYYVVWKKKDGTTHLAYGSPDNPKIINMLPFKRRFLIHQNSSYYVKKMPVVSIKDRFGDDEIEEQISVYSADAKRYRTDRLGYWGSWNRRVTGVEAHSSLLKMQLSKFKEFSFYNSLGETSLLYAGDSASNRIKIHMDGLEIEDGFQEMIDWNSEGPRAHSLTLNDGADRLNGLSGGLFGSFHINTHKRKGFSLGLGTQDFNYLRAAMLSGGSIGPLENYLQGNLKFKENNLNLSSVLQSEFWWSDKNESPLVKSQVHFLFRKHESDLNAKVIWNAGLTLELPVAAKMDSHLSISAGQSFQDSRVARLKVRSENAVRVSQTHKFSFGGFIHFSSLRDLNEKDAASARLCETAGLTASPLQNCRFQAGFKLQDVAQLGHIALVSSGMEISGASNQRNDLGSIFHPSIKLQLAPNERVELGVAVFKSARSPSINEHLLFSQLSTDAFLSSEKLRQFMISVRGRIPTKYAFFQIGLQGRTGWIDDGISAVLKGNQVLSFENKDSKRVSSLRLDMRAELAGGHSFYGGFEMHPSTAGIQIKTVFLGKIELEKFGQAVFELQSGSKEFENQLNVNVVNLYYQSKKIFDHFSIDVRAVNILARSLENENYRPGFYFDVMMDL